MKLIIPENISSIKPYTPGKPIEELEREYGISDSVKIASNENPLGPSPLAVKAVRDAVENLHRYPDGSGYNLIKKLSEKLGVPPGNIILGNGSDEVISMLACAFLRPGNEAIIPRPSFLMYEIIVNTYGATPVFVPLKSLSIDLDGIVENLSEKTRMIFICNPNNPTGTPVLKNDFIRFLDKIPDHVLIIMDEAYIEFTRDKNCVSSMEFFNSGRALITLRTFSKVYGLAGLRIGYGVMPFEIIDFLNRIRLPFNINSLALAGAGAALEDDGFLKKTVALVHEGLDFLNDSLDRLGIEYFSTQANFFLINVKKDADEVYENLLRQGVITRSMSSYGYPEYIRVNAGIFDENVRFIKALENVL